MDANTPALLSPDDCAWSAGKLAEVHKYVFNGLLFHSEP